MIIQILSNLFEEGYLHREDYSLLSGFFAGANVAFRRQALSQVGPYDVNCHSGEDQDMCLRIAHAGWDLYFEPKAIVRHRNKMTLRAFVRRWFDYGLHHPYIFKKHSSKGIRVYQTNRGSRGKSLYSSLINMKSPFNIHLFLTSFLTMHMLLVLTALLAIIGAYIPAIAGGLVTLAIAALYFRWDINRKNILQSIVFIFLRYAANLALLLGGFLGGIKLRMLYISATFDY